MHPVTTQYCPNDCQALDGKAAVAKQPKREVGRTETLGDYEFKIPLITRNTIGLIRRSGQSGPLPIMMTKPPDWWIDHDVDSKFEISTFLQDDW